MTDNVQPVEQWRVAGYQGQHDEEGIVIDIGRGMKMRTPSIYDVAHALGLSHHDSRVWAEYHAIAKRIVSDHNRIAVLEQALRAIGYGVNEPSLTTIERLRDMRKIARAALGEGKENG